jgi:uncharacterized membrane protein YhhN
MQSKLARFVPLAAAVGFVATALFIFGVILDLYWVRVLSKPFPVLSMMVVVAAYGRGRYANTILAGLGLCIFGDIFLEISDATFLAGLVAFLLGHVAYIVAFVGRSRALRPIEFVPFAIWVGWLVSFLWPHLGPMRIPTLAYGSVIMMMMWRATAMVAGERKLTGWDWAAMLGAITFGLSDSLIALDRFHAPIDGVRIPIILTYWVGQLLIAGSALSSNADQ